MNPYETYRYYTFRIALVISLALLILAGHVPPHAVGQSGEPVELSILIADPSEAPIHAAIAERLANDLAALGIQVTLDPQPLDVVSELSENQHDYDLTIMGYWAFPPDPFFFLQPLYSGSAHSPGYNASGYRNSAFNILYNTLARELDIEVRREAAFELQQIAAADLPVYPLVHVGRIAAYNHRDFTLVPPQTPEATWHPPYLLLEPRGERDTVRVAFSGNPEDLAFQILDLTYDVLLGTSPLLETPRLASEVIYLGSSVVQVELRQDHTFRNGDPITGRDVANSYTRWRRHHDDYALRLTAPIAIPNTLQSIPAILGDPDDPFIYYGDDTVRFELYTAQDESLFLVDALTSWPIFPADTAWKIDSIRLDSLPDDGSGPYMLESVDVAAGRVLLVKDVNHFAADEYRTERLEFILYPDDEATFAALLADEVDYASVGDFDFGFSPAQAAEIEASGHLALYSTLEPLQYNLIFNTRREPLNQAKFRHAIAYAIVARA